MTIHLLLLAAALYEYYAKYFSKIRSFLLVFNKVYRNKTLPTSPNPTPSSKNKRDYNISAHTHIQNKRYTFNTRSEIG